MESLKNFPNAITDSEYNYGLIEVSSTAKDGTREIESVEVPASEMEKLVNYTEIKTGNNGW